LKSANSTLAAWPDGHPNPRQSGPRIYTSSADATDLPEAFQHLRHLLEARMGNRGKREFIQVLRLMEAMPKDLVAWAVTEAIRLGAIGFDAVKLIALARLERRPPRLDLSAYPHLPRPAVRATMAADYTVLVPEVAA
jgi:hypothetical protein